MKIDCTQATSLTMAFCKLMIEAQGGTLGVEDEFTRASYVWFTLSAAPAQ
jgi:K+-sensing histidine kinase KdpD